MDDVITPRKCDTGRGRDLGIDLLEQQSVLTTTDDSMISSIADNFPTLDFISPGCFSCSRK